MDFGMIEELIKLAKTNHLQELKLRYKDLSIFIRRHGEDFNISRGKILTNVKLSQVVREESAAIKKQEEPITGEIVKVTSPMAGVFYKAPTPGARSFVEVGNIVFPGQTLCIIEAMKMMNEIVSEVSGRVIQILAENGSIVEKGETLFLISTDRTGEKNGHLLENV